MTSCKMLRPSFYPARTKDMSRSWITVVHLSPSIPLPSTIDLWGLMVRVATMSGGGRSSSLHRRADLLALSNLRSDGRQPHEIRRVHIEMGVWPHAVGSAVVQMGLTSCCAVVNMEGPRRSEELMDRAILDVSLQVTPFCSPERRVVSAHSDRRLVEAGMQIQKALEATVLLQTYPKTRIGIQILILSEDGGRLCAALNAATLALMDAGVAMKDFCCAITAGGSSLDASTVLVDMNRAEETNSTATVTVALLPQRNGTIVLTQCSDARLPNFESLERIMDAAAKGCHAIFECMQAAVHRRAAVIMAANHSGLAN